MYILNFGLIFFFFIFGFGAPLSFLLVVALPSLFFFWLWRPSLLLWRLPFFWVVAPPFFLVVAPPFFLVVALPFFFGCGALPFFFGCGASLFQFLVVSFLVFSF